MIDFRKLSDRTLELWWPYYVFVFPMFFWATSGGAYILYFSARLILNFFSIFAFFFEFKNNEKAKRLTLIEGAAWLVQNPPVILVSIYGVWVVFSGFFTRNPAVALTGSTNLNSGLPISFGSSLWELLFCFIFILVYVRAKKDNKLKNKIFLSVTLSGVIMVVLALLETFIGRSIFLGASNAESQLPYVFFTGRGHLAGFLCICAACSLLVRKYLRNSDIFTYFLCFGIGLTQNRASVVAIGVIFFLLFMHKTRGWLKIFIFSSLSLLSGSIMSQQLLFSNVNLLVRTQGDLSSGRQLLWKAALGGIRAEPLFGYGGSNFEYYWASFLSKEELNEFTKGYVKDVSYVKHNGIFFVSKDKNEKVIFFRIIDWHAHNIFLDKATHYGIPGLLFYLSIIFLSIKNGFRDKSYLTVLVYQIYLLTWFATEASQGTYWVVTAVVAATTAVTRSSIAIPKSVDYSKESIATDNISSSC
jgi:O-antigen ligase